ncbi:MAG: hypothetical protein H7Z11_20110, partial [Verrucomicrobia bacterium]|nr:hypothetical protein [Leptolyngbya sp. ES-bin-22]
LKTYAQANLRYKEARKQAGDARGVLDRALNAGEPEPKASTKGEN